MKFEIRRKKHDKHGTSLLLFFKKFHTIPIRTSQLLAFQALLSASSRGGGAAPRASRARSARTSKQRWRPTLDVCKVFNHGLPKAPRCPAICTTVDDFAAAPGALGPLITYLGSPCHICKAGSCLLQRSVSGEWRSFLERLVAVRSIATWSSSWFSSGKLKQLCKSMYDQGITKSLIIDMGCMVQHLLRTK